MICTNLLGNLPPLLLKAAKIIEEFQNSTLNFSVGYFEGHQSSKTWLVSADLHAMYFTFQQSGKTDICL